MEYKLRELRTYMIDEDLGVYEMMQEIPLVDVFDQTNKYNGKSKEEVKQEIKRYMQSAYGLNIEREYPQCENYIMFVNDKPVCIGGLMLTLDDFWKRHRGNIWYKTRPTERDKGYCTKFLGLLCERAKEFGLKQLVSQCNIDNIPSKKVLEKNSFVKNNDPSLPKWDNTLFYKKEL